jgi:hypothetical protein
MACWPGWRLRARADLPGRLADSQCLLALGDSRLHQADRTAGVELPAVGDHDVPGGVCGSLVVQGCGTVVHMRVLSAERAAVS